MPILRQLLAATALGAATLLACRSRRQPGVRPSHVRVVEQLRRHQRHRSAMQRLRNRARGPRRPRSVVYTFGENPADPAHPYIRYGKPAIVPNAAGTGVIVRYASPYDSGAKKFTEATPAATSPYPVTMGHQCWTFGDPVNYPTSGCEHFGVSLLGNPTKTTYRWLVGDNATGTLKVAGSYRQSEHSGAGLRSRAGLERHPTATPGSKSSSAPSDRGGHRAGAAGATRPARW